jgi:hypothetical protein
LRRLRRGLARLVGASAAVVVALQVAGGASAQTATDSQRQFASAFVAAMRSGDPASLRTVMHPATLACETGPARDYVEAIYSLVLHDGARFGPAFKIHQVLPMESATAGGPGFPFPVQPSHRMQLDSDSPGHSLAMNVWIVQAGGGWRAVYPCPDAAGMKVFRENRARSDASPAAARH